MGAAGTAIPGMWGQEGRAPDSCGQEGLFPLPQQQQRQRHRALPKALPGGAVPACRGRSQPRVQRLCPGPCSQPSLPSTCALTACPSNTGPAGPAGAFSSGPHCDTFPVMSPVPQRITSQPSPPFVPAPAQPLRVALVYWLRLLLRASSSKNFPWSCFCLSHQLPPLAIS